MNTVLALQNLAAVVEETEAPGLSTISNCCGN
ncbi:class III lanthipeptide [Amycolatopsis sp. cg5]